MLKNSPQSLKTTSRTDKFILMLTEVEGEEEQLLMPFYIGHSSGFVFVTETFDG